MNSATVSTASREMNFYEVKLDGYGSGCIFGYEIYSTKTVRDPLKRAPAFKISFHDGAALTQCLRGHQDPHPCDIHLEESSDGKNFLAVVCQDPDKFHRHSQGIEHECVLFKEKYIGPGNPTYVDLATRRWQSHLKTEKCHTFENLDIPGLKDKVPIQPGLFKGTYGAHGTEIVMLTYDDETNEVHVRKITGDPNVPAGERSICADLSRPMVLTDRQQESVSVLRDIDIGDPPWDDGAEHAEPPRQPFVVPRDCDNREASSLPDTCLYRYHSLGTVSPVGYRNPEQIVNHFIVFDENTFGVLWLELYSLGLYCRVVEEFETYTS